MCDFIARTNWSNIKSNYFMDNITIFDLSYYTNIMITVRFMNHLMLCRAFFLFLSNYNPHKSCTIFHIDLYVFNIHTEISNGTNKLNHVKRLAVFQNEPFGIPCGRMNHLCRDWNKRMLTMKGLSSTNRLPCPSFFCTWCDKQCCHTWLHPFNRGRWFFVWGLFLQQAHCYLNQWNTALREAEIVSKMRTQEINETLLSRKQQLCQKCKHPQSHFDFPNTDSKKFSTWVSLLKKKIASPVVFLVKSKHWVLAEIRFFVCLRFF